MEFLNVHLPFELQHFMSWIYYHIVLSNINLTIITTNQFLPKIHVFLTPGDPTKYNGRGNGYSVPPKMTAMIDVCQW